MTELERLTRRYTQEMIPFIGPQVDVMAPDLGTNEQIMAWMMDTYSVHVGYTVPSIVTGKPVGLGGSLGRREATGRGVGYLVNRATDTIGLDIEQSHRRGAGLRQRRLGRRAFAGALRREDHRRERRHRRHLQLRTGSTSGSWRSTSPSNKTVVGFPEAEPITNEQLLVLPCDILVPAALERQITEANAGKIQCRILAEAANGPTTPEADAILESAPGDFRHPRRAVQRRRRDRVLLRVGAGPAKLLLGRNRGGGQAVPHPGNRLHPDPDRRAANRRSRCAWRR